MVRDNIPKIIESHNETAITRVLDKDEYKKELLKKLKEECDEVINSNSQTEFLEELADVYEVLNALAKTEEKNIKDVEKIAKEKRLVKGGFNDKFFLIKTK